MSEPSATILVRVIPRAGRTSFAGKRGDALLVRLAASPVDGAANDALIGFVAALLRCPRRAVSIVSGARARNKRLRVDGLTPVELDRRIAGLVGASV
jgi:uncharacterized protein YggU (UPF0235/DUF167 family)